jgi:NAD(P)-dependent dehydrogenase (short-subunit alcohol dehydrogenase family)
MSGRFGSHGASAGASAYCASKWAIEGLTLALGLTIIVVTLTQWTLRVALGW